MSRSRMASAYVGSPMKACHLSTGIWLVRMVERRPGLDVADAGRLTRYGIAQPGGEPLGAAMGELAIEQEAEPVGMSERGGFVGSFELGKCLGHAGQAKLAQLVEHWMGKQRQSPQW